jgi:hypothetical protein
MLNPKELVLRPFPAALSEFQSADFTTQRRIIACPNPPIEAVQKGYAISLSSSEFDIHDVLQQLPSTFQPDLVSLSARKMGFQPQGLDRLSCPTLMKIGDTFHWGDGSLNGIVRYCRSLNCDFHWVYQGVQHLHWFVEAGLKNVFWLPGTPVIDPYVPSKPAEKLYGVIFRGSESHLHAYRSQVLRYLQQADVEVDIQQKPYLDCLEDYVRAQIVLNCSLNGDTNRRVFEVLMAGGFLLTDRLSPQTGIQHLFREGEHLECYGSLPELVEKVKFYLAHPEKAEQIAIAGQQQLLSHYNQSLTQQKLHRYVFTQEIEPPFRLEHDRRITVIPKDQPSESLDQRLQLYQLIQELHRINPQLHGIYWRGRHRQLLADLVDLARLKLSYVESETAIEPVKTWCTEIDIDRQVHWETPETLQSPAQLILIDLPETLQSARERLAELDPHLAASGLLLFIGQASMQQKTWLDFVLRSKSYQPTTISVDYCNWHEPLGAGVCLTYVKSPTSDQSSPMPLTFTQLTWQTKMQQAIRVRKTAIARRVAQIKR